eukprot:TRINITY_DN34484_c0_g1_i1.p1 TRINITY_DN34484_c0_g1~~TRINITY_DN34484_c0_g1_i1.p1  ORF type:complete len:424 (+),score=79.03 TRINITY_DN34484_c0_g1_i1:72-1343(+)
MSETSVDEVDNEEPFLTDEQLTEMFMTTSHTVMYEDDVVDPIDVEEEPQEWVEYEWTARPSALAMQRTEDTLRQLLPYFDEKRRRRYLNKILPPTFARGEKVAFRTKCGWRNGTLQSVNSLGADIKVEKMTIFDWDINNLRKPLDTREQLIAHNKLMTQQLIKIITDINDLPHDARRVIMKNRDDLRQKRVWFDDTAEYPTIIGTLFIDPIEDPEGPEKPNNEQDTETDDINYSVCDDPKNFGFYHDVCESDSEEAVTHRTKSENGNFQIDHSRSPSPECPVKLEGYPVKFEDEAQNVKTENGQPPSRIKTENGQPSENIKTENDHPPRRIKSEYGQPPVDFKVEVKRERSNSVASSEDYTADYAARVLAEANAVPSTKPSILRGSNLQAKQEDTDEDDNLFVPSELFFTAPSVKRHQPDSTS